MTIVELTSLDLHQLGAKSLHEFEYVNDNLHRQAKLYTCDQDGLIHTELTFPSSTTSALIRIDFYCWFTCIANEAATVLTGFTCCSDHSLLRFTMAQRDVWW